MEAATEVWVPIALLTSDELRATEKVTWLAFRLDYSMAQKKLFSPTWLAGRIGLSRPTVRKAREKLIAEGWYAGPSDADVPLREELADEKVAIPGELIMSTDVKAQAKVVYGALQALPDYEKRQGSFTYATLAEMMNLSAKTVKRAICHLVERRWLKVEQVNKHAPIHFTLRNPVRAKHNAEMKRVENEIDAAPFYGEALMRALLSAIIDSKSYHDGATPDLLKNPLTGEHLEYDRFYYHHSVAFEFNGQQHYTPTECFDEEVVAAQKERDRIKQELSKDEGITLIVIRGEELSWQVLVKRIGKMLPLRRGVNFNRKLIGFLESRCRAYRQKATRGWAPSGEACT